MTCIVTGAAGFIGSHLSRRLLAEGHEVRGIDAFIDFYPRWIKERNLEPLLKNKGFRFHASDINKLDLPKVLDGVDYVFHQAAQAGVRSSWGSSFSVYTDCNISATQRLLEACRKVPIQKFIFASSSSVYGLCPDLPWRETSLASPFSPYGVTKLAAEHLCTLYHRNHGVPTISLRYFTVYGPGQRPDMAFHRFLRSALEDRPISVFGSGNQTRDFTFVDDIIEANVSSMIRGKAGEVYNIGGGNTKVLKELFPLLETICGKTIVIEYTDTQKGDVPDTYADIAKARRDLLFSPQVGLEEGLTAEWQWIRSLHGAGRPVHQNKS
jgi:nucleoside-diphosphate-sugar epimerase